MTGLVDELYEDCEQTAGWAMQGISDLASILIHSGWFHPEQSSRDTMSSAFFSALGSRDVSKATELGQLSGNWPALAMGAITQLDQAWQDDTLSIGDITEAYWTLRRTLDALTANPVRATGRSLSIGAAVVYVPSSEQHTFGPQMLVDKINRAGWDAQLWHSLGSSAIMEQLSSKHVDVLGISVGTDNRLHGLADLISDVRFCSINPDIKIVIGGSAICGTSVQYEFLGADWVAASAEDSLQFFQHGWSELQRREGRFNG
ncbi:B12-binding domain-containing protein [Yoonia sp. R2-816]|uniref:cobalamin B12-binding domain-containing protein n=1 Tax=Yoonia sp. R2-816 TaxID=3342638 RepID=UPI00372C8D56